MYLVFRASAQASRLCLEEDAGCDLGVVIACTLIQAETAPAKALANAPNRANLPTP